MKDVYYHELIMFDVVFDIENFHKNPYIYFI